jgi:hypothetical protein|nr:MAG TPA: head closure knob [Bacteriophage sp.]
MQEWYLMTPETRPNITGGFENDAFLDYKEDAFAEALSTDIAKTVILCNSDMTEIGETRVIIMDNLANTQLKSIERSVFAVIGTLKAGMYMKFENQYWLISGYPGNNGVCEKATAILCQYELIWQDDDGKIIRRWANFTSASKYDNGRSGNSTIILTSNNFTIWIPEDDDGTTLDGRRVFIDRVKTGQLPTKVFEITRSDDVLYLFGKDHGGILSFIADKDELNKVTDRQDLWICNYKSPITPTLPPSEPDNPTTSVTITGGDTLRYGRAKTWTVTFSDSENQPNFTWNVKSDFKITQNITGNKIQLKCTDDKTIDCTFTLQVLDNESNILSETTITIIM